jgi:hypothetical protein
MNRIARSAKGREVASRYCFPMAFVDWVAWRGNHMRGPLRSLGKGMYRMRGRGLGQGIRCQHLSGGRVVRRLGGW